MGRLMDPTCQTYSHLYSEPRLGQQLQLTTDEARLVKTGGKTSAARRDRKRHVLLSSCTAGYLGYSAQFGFGGGRYVGINLLDRWGEPLWGKWDTVTDDDGLWNIKVDVTVGDSNIWTPIRPVEQFDAAAEFLLLKGGYEPQAWFELAESSTLHVGHHGHTSIRVCATTNRTLTSVGAVVFV